MIDTSVVRNRIIDIALEGKLSKRDKSDSDVNLLLEHISKKNGIDLAVSEDAIPFEIPSGWRWIRLGWVMDVERGGSPRPIKEYITTQTDGINWIKIGDVAKDGKYITETKEKIKPEGEKKSRRVYPGDFLLTNSMSFGRPYISKIEGCIHDGWLVLHNTEEVFDLNFLYYLLSSTYAYAQFTQKASGSTVDNLNKDKVGDALVPVPPLEEQKRIVESIEGIVPILKTIDDLQEQYADDREVLRRKLIDAGIQGKLTAQLPEDGSAVSVLNDLKRRRAELVESKEIRKKNVLPEVSVEDYPFDIPQSWKWVHISDAWAIINGDRGKNYPAKSTLSHTGIPFISALNLDGSTVVSDDKLMCLSDEQYERLGSGKLKKGDVVVCIRGSLGKHGKYPFEKGAIASSLIISRNYIQNEIINDYLMIYLDSQLFKDEIEKYNGGSAQPNLAAENFEKFRIPFPPLAEQKRIVGRVKELLGNITE